jgi:adenylate cyclase
MPKIFIISRNSTFTYKGKPVKVKQVAEELTVQYVIEGSVQRSADQLRVTVQMIDALTGYHVWSEQYDRNMEDIFKIQDDIALNIVKKVGVDYDQYKLHEMFESGTIAGTKNLDAYLKILNALTYYMKRTPQGHRMAKKLAEEAKDLDPKYMMAFAILAVVYAEEVRWGISESVERSFEDALKYAKKAVSIGDFSAQAHGALGLVLYNMREHDKAIEVFEKAIQLDPEYGNAHSLLGWTLTYAGKPQESVAYFKKAIRLDPLYRAIYLLGMGAASLYIGKYEEAVVFYKKAIEIGPPYFRFHTDLAACYAALGKEDQAKAEIEKALRLNPRFSREKHIMRLPAKDPKFVKPYVEALRKIPFPE